MNLYVRTYLLHVHTVTTVRVPFRTFTKWRLHRAALTLIRGRVFVLGQSCFEFRRALGLKHAPLSRDSVPSQLKKEDHLGKSLQINEPRRTGLTGGPYRGSRDVRIRDIGDQPHHQPIFQARARNIPYIAIYFNSAILFIRIRIYTFQLCTVL